MSFDGKTLFNLLPAVYRIKDAALAGSAPLLSPAESERVQFLQSQTGALAPDEQAELQELLDKSTRGPLQSLIMVVAEQLAAVENDLDQLYDDQFIETCAPWVIPYIGDLIGFQSGYRSVTGVASVAANLRAEVAHTISFRRRKGTVLVLEQVARDATGWGARAVEFFKVLACTQYMNHLRLYNHYAPNLRRWESREYMNTGFDKTAHTVDVRRIVVERGRYNIRNVGIFLWSLTAYGLTQSPAAASTAAGCFRFNPLGADMPLFNNPVPQSSNDTALATPLNVPDRLRRQVLCRDISSQTGAYYGEGQSLALYVRGTFISVNEIQICDLSGEDGHWANLPVASSYRAAIDPQLGRIAVADASPSEQVAVSFYYGFNGEMGGGEYPRNTSQSPFVVTDTGTIYPFPDVVSPPRYTTLQEAINYVISLNAATGHAAIEFSNTQTYVDTGTAPLTIALPTGMTLEIRAADNGVVRTRTTLLLNSGIVATGGANSTLALNGLVIAANQATAIASPAGASLLQVPDSKPDGTVNLLGNLNLTHCTVVPGSALGIHSESLSPAPSLVANAAGLQVTVNKSILGAVRADEFVTFSAADSIIDATNRESVAYAAPDESSGGGALTLTGCTVFGRVHATLFSLISNCIVWAQVSQTGSPSDSQAAALLADRRQEGCVRFSYLPANAVVPRQFQCVFEGQGFDEPLFYSLRYGQPAYCKLFPSTRDTVRRGADDGGEMGAFHFLSAPMRETDLLTRLQEYLPAGLESGIFYET
jgi:hypothetical protein